MKPRRGKIALFAIVALAAAGGIIMALWNLLIPDIFGLTVINFWQALGLFVLSRILFGRFGFRGNGMMRFGQGHPIHEKWRNMTPEQRKEFISKRRKFGFGPPFGRERCDTEAHGEQTERN